MRIGLKSASGPDRRTTRGRRRAALALVVALACVGAARPDAGRAEIPPEVLTKIVSLLEEGRDEEVRSLERRALEDVARQFGVESIAHADALDLLLQARLAAGLRDTPTLRFAEHAVELRLRLEGAPTTELMESLGELAYLLHVDGDLSLARDFYLSLLDLQSLAHGADGDATLLTRVALGNLETDLGDLTADLSLIERGKDRMSAAVAAGEARYGVYDPRAATLRRYLALRLFAEERYAEAQRIYRTNLKTHRDTAPVDESAVARSHHNLGEVAYRLGEIAAAREHLSQALESRLSLQSRFVANTYSSLADLASDTGEFERARGLYEHALAGQSRQWGEDPYRYAETLSRLALLLEQIGDWVPAFEYQGKAARIRSDKLGTDDRRTARSLQRLGALRLRVGDLDGAEADLTRALEVQEARLGPGHSELVATLVGLADVHEARGRTGAAEDLLRRALAGLDFVTEVNPASSRRAERVEPLGRLARLLRRQGSLSEAAPLIDEAEQLVISIFGQASDKLAPIHAERAVLRLEMEDPDAAIDWALAAETVRRRHVQSTIQTFPESQALLFAQIAETALDTALSALQRLGTDASQVQVAAVWDAVVSSRGLVLEAVAARQRLIRASRDPRLAELAAAVEAARGQVAALTLRGPGGLPLGVHQRLLEESRGRLAAADRELAAVSTTFSTGESARVGLDEVLYRLPAQGGLLAVVHYRVDGGATTHYGAFTHSAGSGTAWRHLGGDVEQSVAEWRRALTEEESVAAGQRLRRLIWDPVSGLLGDVETVYLVASGATLLVNFAALPTPDGAYLIERRPTFHHLNSEREIYRFATELELGTGLLAIGAVDYSGSDGAGASAASSEANAAPTRGWSSCRRFHRRRFEALPATGEELERITDLWRSAKPDPEEAVQRLTGREATEVEFKRHAPGKAVIHVATHGFFLQGRCHDDPAPVPGSRQAVDPLALSGLVLAGANQRDGAESGTNDGVLTALEVVGLDLGGVGWAVLSACDTGRGQIDDSEGVLGLRRALSVAGVRTVIMSLWPIEDAATQRWMSRLYELRFVAGYKTADAVRAASLSLLRDRREAKLDTHPARWAGFIASGDWR